MMMMMMTMLMTAPLVKIKMFYRIAFPNKSNYSSFCFWPSHIPHKQLTNPHQKEQNNLHTKDFDQNPSIYGMERDTRRLLALHMHS